MRTPALLFALAAGAAAGGVDWKHDRGMYFDCWGRTEKAVADHVWWADEAGSAFHGIHGSFPGGRAAILLQDEKKSGGEPDWRKAGAAWTWPWPEDDLASKLDAALGKARLPAWVPSPRSLIPAEDVFRHELGHWIFVQHVEAVRKGKGAPSDGYGSAAPDWLDESAAMLCESKSGRDRYRAAMAASAQFIPLRHLFKMRHSTFAPGFPVQPIPGRTPRPGFAAGGRGYLFYAESHSVSEFLLDRFGAPLYRKVLEVQLAGKPVEEALRWLRADRARKGEPVDGLPASDGDLERAWLAWLGAPV